MILKVFGALSFVLVNFAIGVSLNKNFELVILHNNDMHGRFEQTNIYSNTCKPTDASSGKCFGGIARISSVVENFRERSLQNEIPPVLFLNAGDTYTGTTWFSLYKDNITAEFLNALKPDAMSLGNHEFDEGVANLADFLNELKFPVIATNMNFTDEPLLAATAIHRSFIFNIFGTKVGVIGYLTPETKIGAKQNNVEYTDEVKAINYKTKKLINEGIKIIIALGHSGVLKDQEIAALCPEVDLVIGGHSHTFLHTGPVPSIEQAENTYPIVVTQSSGKKVPVVQAYAFTKYLGRLNLEFDPAGNLLKFDGAPILLDATIPEDPLILELLEIYRPGVDALANEVIGSTKVFLDGNCRENECNLGNLIADSMVDWYATKFPVKSDKYWTNAAIALQQSGGVRTSIDHRNYNGIITRDDALRVLPFNDNIMLVEATGAELLSALEHSVFTFPEKNDGTFLQVSGMKVIFDLSLPAGQRVMEAKVLCADCLLPIYEKLDVKKIYKILMPFFITNGGNGYKFKDSKSVTDIGETDLNVFVEFIRKRSPIMPKVEMRTLLLSKKFF